jgi:hypothetical protein
MILNASTGNRTRVIRLEGEYANHYTIDADVVIPGFEPGIRDSKSHVLTTTLYDQSNVIKRCVDHYTTLDYSSAGIRTRVCG